MAQTTAPARSVTPGERAALTTVVTVEQLTNAASRALDAGDLDRVHALFDAILAETTARATTARATIPVTDQALVDHIHTAAGRAARSRFAKVNEELAAARAETAAAVEARTRAADLSITDGLRPGW